MKYENGDEFKVGVRRNKRKGFEFLEADTEIFNALIDAQREYPHIIGRYNIQLINEDYMDREKMDVNNMYVVRLDSKLKEAGFQYDVYETGVQVVICTSQYDAERALAFLKTTIKAVKQVVGVEPLSAFTSLDEISPEYIPPGKVTGAILKFNCSEVDDQICVDDDELYIGLKLKAHVMHTQEFEHVFPPMNLNEKLPLQEHYDDDDNDFAGG